MVKKNKNKVNKSKNRDINILGVEGNDIESIDLIDGDSTEHASKELVSLSHEIEDPSDIKYASARTMIEQIMFKIPYVRSPLIGTPNSIQKELDELAKKLQKMKRRSKSYNHDFNRIHLYMHGYLIDMVLKRFPFIRGLQSVDVYQEALIALRFKAIPGFQDNKGMSFLNFAKMCIRRHLITLLNTSRTRKKDQSINQALSLDSVPDKNNDGDTNTLSNIIADKTSPVSEVYERSEAYLITKKALMDALSDFEKVVLAEYLSSSSYKEISKNVSVVTKKKYNAKSIDNALLRIRKKATHLKEYGKVDDLPIFIHQSRPLK